MPALNRQRRDPGPDRRPEIRDIRRRWSMTRQRASATLAAAAIVAVVVAACSGTAGGSAGAPSAPAASVAASASDTTGGRGGIYDYGRGGDTGGGAAVSVAPGTVALSGYAFQPATLSVATGTTVTFTNSDSVAHAIVEGQDGTPAAGQTAQTVQPGQSVTHAFTTAGTVMLTCTIHPSMQLTVTVGP
jgi:plastocyanin